MDNSVIATKVKELKSVKDLARLLSSIKKEYELETFGSAGRGVTEKMLKFFACENIEKERFHTFQIPKKSGGMREINAPCKDLKRILTVLNILFKAVYTPSEAAMGFTTGRSVVENAQKHTEHNYVFNIDLKDFFPSIPQARVWKRIQLPPFNFTQEIANVVAGLCCCRDEQTGLNVLPQGSPASPLLTNAICDKLDRRMLGVAKRFGLHYTRYADDMTFSSMHNVYQEDGEFRREIQRLIEQQGFRMNEKKTRLQKRDQRQEVTGLTVNSKANVTKKYVRQLRWILHAWEKFGYEQAYALFYPRYKHEKGYVKKGEPIMENVVGGKLNYLKMVKGDNNPTYQKLLARFETLVPPVFSDTKTEKKEHYVYVNSYTIPEFKEQFATDLYFEISEKGKIVGKCQIDGKEKQLSVSASTQCLFNLPEPAAELAPGTRVENEKLQESGTVTLCRAKGKNFWLITKSPLQRSRCLSPQNANIDVDKLLDFWDEEGLRFAVANLILSIDPTKGIDPEIIEQDNLQTLLRFFMHRRTLTHAQRSRFERLLSRDFVSLNNSADSNQKYSAVKKESLVKNEGPVGLLLRIWEQQGLSEAARYWEFISKMLNERWAESKGEKSDPEPSPTNGVQEDVSALLNLEQPSDSDSSVVAVF